MHNICYLILLFFFVTQAQDEMSVSEASVLREKVKNRAVITKTITSDFVQYKHLNFLSDDIVTKGSLVFKVPNLVKWSYINPFAYTIIFKNSNLYINDEGQKSNVNLSSNKLFKQFNEFIVNSIKGDMFDENNFEINYFKDKLYSDVRFVPLNNKIANYIKRIHIYFNSKGDVVEMKMIEPSGDFTRVVFVNRVLNQTVPDALFNH